MLTEAARHEFTLRLNGAVTRVRVDPWTALLDLLREDLCLAGTKKGCDQDQCGACTVLVDGHVANHSLADYHVPVNADVPAIEVITVPEADALVNEVGAKGIGEIGITDCAAAIANAVFHATGRRARPAHHGRQAAVDAERRAVAKAAPIAWKRGARERQADGMTPQTAPTREGSGRPIRGAGEGPGGATGALGSNTIGRAASGNGAATRGADGAGRALCARMNTVG